MYKTCRFVFESFSFLSFLIGILFHEPSAIEDAFYQLKRFIYLLIKDAYESKFPNKTQDLQFTETYEDYSLHCFEYEDDFLNSDLMEDRDLKLNSQDILESFTKLTGKTFFFADARLEAALYAGNPEAEPIEQGSDEAKSDDEETDSDQSLSEDQDELQEEETPLLEESTEKTTSEEQGDSQETVEEIIEETGETVDDEDEIPESEIDDLEEETSNLDEQKIEITDETFIDDSYNFNFDLEDLGETLPEQLMKVSIRVHEEIYGKERAHREKLYLKNWYGNCDLFFVNCSKELENPNTEIVEPQDETMEETELNENMDEIVQSSIEENNREEIAPSESNLTEYEQIEQDRKEDLEYFGYSLYESDMNEFPIVDLDDSSPNDEQQATEEESLQYHLRRMLREQSYECILNYFESTSD